MEKITKIDVAKLFSAPEKIKGIEKYADIMQTFYTVNVATEKDFQKKFNAFYRVRRGQDWQHVFYNLMEENKNKQPSFEKILREIYCKTGRIEASFTSKLLHTLNTDMPIWDKFVLQNLGVKTTACSGEEKILMTISIYEKIVAWYKKALSTNQIYQKTIDFDNVFTEYKWFSPTKKIDFLLWQMR